MAPFNANAKWEEEKPRPAFNPAVAYIRQLRPRQWTKNLLVFAALIFSVKSASVAMLGQAVVAFVLFCLVSSCVYIMNDYTDRESDRLHPEKRHRPMASGAINPHAALFFGCVLLIACIGTAFALGVSFGFTVIVYFAVNVLYSVKLKHVVIFDLLLIASGFVLRAIGGGLAIGVPLTPWFLVCTLLLALFLAIGKRKHELNLLKTNGAAHRKVLAYYSQELLNQLVGIVTTATLISYALFTFTSGHTIHLMWTIVFVLYGIFRYLYLIHMEGKGGRPEKVLLEDKPILLTVVLYAFSVAFILVYME